MSYFKKSHQHKPKKGKGSYDRKAEYFEEVKARNFKESTRIEYGEEEECPVNTTTVDGVTHRKS